MRTRTGVPQLREHPHEVTPALAHPGRPPVPPAHGAEGRMPGCRGVPCGDNQELRRLKDMKARPCTGGPAVPVSCRRGGGHADPGTGGRSG